ncbi:MAG: hypothetical protein ACR2M1_14550, partial [Gemmatimonadaceae bacterium]
MPDEYNDARSAPLGHPDHRGTTGAPPEGRRESDPAHALLAEKLAAFEEAAKLAETTARKTRSIILTITIVVGAVVSLTTWLGSKNLGPGARADAIEAKVDRNLEYAQRSDSSKGRRDSIQDMSIARI